MRETEQSKLLFFVYILELGQMTLDPNIFAWMRVMPASHQLSPNARIELSIAWINCQYLQVKVKTIKRQENNLFLVSNPSLIITRDNLIGMNLRDVTDNTTPSLTLGAKFLYSCQTPGKVIHFVNLI